MLLDDIKKIKSTSKELKSFGFTVGLVFVVLGGLLLWRGKGAYPFFLATGASLIVLGKVAPFVLKPLQRVWMTLALLLGWVMTRVLLSVFFFLVLTPISVFGRILGQRFLETSKSPSESSYWIERDLSGMGKEHFEKQY